MLIAQRPTLTEKKLSDRRSQFTLEPLEPGFGYTLGNSLRRTLLSSIPGAAVTSVRITGALHEFTTLPGVKEDVTELLLNIKGIVLTSEYDEPVVMYLRKSGEGEVTAGDINPPAGVTICNPDFHLATLAEDGSLEIEFTVERGRGYVPAQMNRQESHEIGRIPIVISKAAKTILSTNCFCLNNLVNKDHNFFLSSFTGLYSIPGAINKVTPVHSSSKRSYDILVIPTS